MSYEAFLSDQKYPNTSCTGIVKLYSFPWMEYLRSNFSHRYNWTSCWKFQRVWIALQATGFNKERPYIVLPYQITTLDPWVHDHPRLSSLYQSQYLCKSYGFNFHSTATAKMSLSAPEYFFFFTLFMF